MQYSSITAVEPIFLKLHLLQTASGERERERASERASERERERERERTRNVFKKKTG